MIPEVADVVVIGGGPGGSMTATFLADQGHDVVLFDKAHHPRYKVGESLIPDFWKYTDRAGVTDKILEEGFIAKSGGMVQWQGVVRSHRFKEFGYDRPAMHVERDRFDEILFRNAEEHGAKTFEGVAVTGTEFLVDDDGRDYCVVSYKGPGEGSGQISCRLAIDASGQAAVIGRQLGNRHIDNAFRYLSVWGYYDGSRFLDYEGTAHDRDDLATDPPVTFLTSLADAGDEGWAWHIPLRKNTSVGIVLPLDKVKGARLDGESWEQFFARRTMEIPIMNSLLEGATLIDGSVQSIADYSFQSDEIAGPGYFLVGDAAGFVDPIFSVGVVLAMYGAGAAAWAADRVLKKPETAAHTRDIYSRQVKGRLEIARSLALPQYRSSGEVSELAKTSIQLERGDLQRLMYAVSSLTTRTDNWLEMVSGEAPELDDGDLRIIETLKL